MPDVTVREPLGDELPWLTSPGSLTPATQPWDVRHPNRATDENTSNAGRSSGKRNVVREKKRKQEGMMIKQKV